MATTYKILGQSEPANTSNAVLYTVPASTEAIVSTIAVANTSGQESSFRIFVVADGDTAGTQNALAYDATIAANSFTSFSLGLTLGAADEIIVRVSTGTTITFHAFGTELT